MYPWTSRSSQTILVATLVLGLLTLAAPPAIADQPLEANAANNFLDWTFKAEPKEYEPGEAPLTGIPDALGGSTSPVSYTHLTLPTICSV